ncbi:MAG: PKD domain-containing protein [Cyclobacteriaceae bacterium]
MKMNSYFKSIMLFSLGLAIVAITSCSEDEDPIDPPLSFFTAEVDASDNLTWNFKDGSQGADSYSWDFGDGGTSTEASPSHTYSATGTYTVVLTATNAGGDDAHSETITVLSNEAVNELSNGDFEDDSAWTAQQFNPNNNAAVTIADGVLTISEVDPDVTWGAEAHGGVWQAVTVEAGTYAFDMDVTTVGADEFWAEVWVGSDEPLADDDYNGDDGASAVLALNTWDCPDHANHTGSIAADNCKDSNMIELTAGTHYVVIRSGGITFPVDGVIFDNISMLKQ